MDEGIKEKLKEYEVYTSALVIERSVEVIGHLLAAGLSLPEVTPNSNRTLSLEYEVGGRTIYLEVGNTKMTGFISMEVDKLLPYTDVFSSDVYSTIKEAFTYLHPTS